MADLVFPNEKAKQVRDDPETRYELGIQYLPLPAAFREAAKGLRAMVRERKREDTPFEQPLRQLYRLACVHNLVGQVGILSNRRLPPGVWKDEEFPYQEIGYEKLDLLGTRDRRRIEKLWGEPEAHRNVGAVLPELRKRFAEHSQKVEVQLEAELEERVGQIGAGSSGGGQERAGCLAVLMLGLEALFGLG